MHVPLKMNVKATPFFLLLLDGQKKYFFHFQIVYKNYLKKILYVEEKAFLHDWKFFKNHHYENQDQRKLILYFILF